MPDNNINPQESQDLTPEDAKASMGIATALQDQLMPQKPAEAPQTQETAPQQAETEEVTPDMETPQETEAEDPEAQKIDELSKNFDEFKGEIKGMIDAKIGDLTQSIKDALK